MGFDFTLQLKASKDGVPGHYDTEIVCREKPEVGMARDYSGSYPIVSVHETKSPDEWGARPQSWHMTPDEPAIPAGKELSYAKVAGRDEITEKEAKGKHFLTKDEHLVRRDFVKGDPKKQRQHGYWWARVTVKGSGIQ